MRTHHPPPAVAMDSSKLSLLLDDLMHSSAQSNDPVIPFLIWTAYEPLVAAEPEKALDWFVKNGMATRPLSEQLLTKVMRRLCDLKGPRPLDLAADFLGQLPNDANSLILAAISGLIE